MALNHKWQNTCDLEISTKPQRCIKCGVFREWYGGDYQAWQYCIPTYFIAINGSNGVSNEHTWDRPDCIPKKDKNKG